MMMMEEEEEEQKKIPPLQHHHQPPPQVPRGRGRPRASFAQTGEFDLGLIREYRGRPSLYDRGCKRFKDKMFVAQQWQQISHKLGYDVSLLRDRMLQLRNRYNIEKRRVENLRAENPMDHIGSQWPLYENLSFLSEHIRTRRSYKMQGASLDEPFDQEQQDQGLHNDSESDSHLQPDVKLELSSDDDQSSALLNGDQLTMLNIPMEYKYNEAHPNGHLPSSASSTTTLQAKYSSRLRHVQPPLQLMVAAPKSERRQRSILQMDEAPPPPVKRSRQSEATNSNYKYRDFGNFVGSSLADLPPTAALRLVEKFTCELVQAAMLTVQSSAEDDEGGDRDEA